MFRAVHRLQCLSVPCPLPSCIWSCSTVLWLLRCTAGFHNPLPALTWTSEPYFWSFRQQRLQRYKQPTEQGSIQHQADHLNPEDITQPIHYSALHPLRNPLSCPPWPTPSDKDVWYSHIKHFYNLLLQIFLHHWHILHRNTPRYMPEVPGHLPQPELICLYLLTKKQSHNLLLSSHPVVSVAHTNIQNSMPYIIQLPWSSPQRS